MTSTVNANFSDVASKVQPPQGMTLADMLNLARNAQAYQQAQQLNPLALQKAEMEIKQAQQINPLDIQSKQLAVQQAQNINPLLLQKAREELSQSQIGTKQKQLELDQSHFNLAGNVLSGLESRALSLSKNNDKTTALKELKLAEQWLNTSGVPSKENGIFKTAENQLQSGDFGGYLATLQNARNIFAGANNRFQSNLPQTTSIANAPATFTPATGTATPLTIGGQGNTTQGGFLPFNSEFPQGSPQGVTQMQLQYPIRRAGDIRPLAPNEDVDTAKGAAYRNSLTTRQTDLATSKRNLDEVIKAATQIEKEDLFTSGILGATERTVKGLLGDPKYKQLSKDLANVQIANIQAQGGSMDTVAGQQLQKMANGDETYPPEILKNIARRTYADVQNLDMQATAASKFAQKFGDSNLNTFKRMWSANADSKVFEAMTIFDNVKDKQARNKAINELFGSDPQARQEYFRKYKNIKKLTETGEL